MPPDDDARIRTSFRILLCKICGDLRRAYVRADRPDDPIWRCFHRLPGAKKKPGQRTDDRQLQLKL